MKLSVSTPSLFAVAAATSQALFSIWPNKAVVAAVEMAYESESSSRSAVNASSLGEECSFAASFKLKTDKADTGVLGCTDPQSICVEDSLSSLGGRCTSNVIVSRDLQHTPACNAKCTGQDACLGLTQDFIDNNIGDKSCCGTRACKGITGATVIGANSCLGFRACESAHDATIGSRSCTGDEIRGGLGLYGYSCTYLEGTVGDDSCYEYGSCYQRSTSNHKATQSNSGFKFNVGDFSCRGEVSCCYTANTGGTLTIDDLSCNDFYACYAATSSFGKGSCNAKQACTYSSGTIGDYVCNTYKECFQNQDTVTAHPTGAPSSMPSSRPSFMPSSQPSSMPSEQPSEQPSSMPSELPSLSSMPSVPSESSSTEPSSMPSELPSSQPSEQPSEQPSSQPSETPSCNPSSAPTPSPSINLFYPDQSTDPQGCMSDGNQLAWMEANPAIWLFTTQEKCCQTHFGWNLPACLGEHSSECATTLWYPDWKGSNKGCLRDGNEPLYMVQNKNGFIFSDKKSCCEEHFSWSFNICMGGIGGTNIAHGGGTVTTVYVDGSGDKYYADWTSATCKNDGLAPEYMINAETIWLYDDLDSCCEQFFWYNLGTCKAGGSSTTSSYTGTNKWYTNWNDSTCYKDCAVGDTDCGGPADFFAANNLFDTKEKCCSTTLSYDYKNCVKA